MKALVLPAERSARGMPDAPVATAHADARGVFGVSMGAAVGTAYKAPVALCPEQQRDLLSRFAVDFSLEHTGQPLAVALFRSGVLHSCVPGCGLSVLLLCNVSLVPWETRTSGSLVRGQWWCWSPAVCAGAKGPAPI